MRDRILNIKNEAIAQITEASNSEELEGIRIEYLGRKGKINELTGNINELSSEEKKQIGILINEVKTTLENEISSKEDQLHIKSAEWFDPTIPGIKQDLGHLHMITQAIQEIEDIFKQIGFVRRRYPEAEWDYFAYTALNFPSDHPARDEMETFFIDSPENKKYGKMLLTPHTSSGQVREMLRVNSKPPIRMLNIAKTYRRESDASHNPLFHQFEGLVVDEGINITHLKGTLEYFVQHFYGPNIKVRLRPHNFKFTEPSFEIDTTCTICEGKNCKVCKEGWLEQAGSGMVHPNVLKAGGIDPKKYSGFAFGWGVERALMMKSGVKIPDLRTLYSTDLRYLRQF
ncbi:phenylalanine--tRNA ligase subunit alpha [Candidatus Woesebacteria bacterium]|nr:phenylalanine--tRNA ligase subunit alpha [Candidatus Woesebacteria bacterium]